MDDEIFNGLDSQLENLEKELEAVETGEKPSIRRKHEQATELLEEIHGQLSFLHEQIRKE